MRTCSISSIRFARKLDGSTPSKIPLLTKFLTSVGFKFVLLGPVTETEYSSVIPLIGLALALAFLDHSIDFMVVLKVYCMRTTL